MTNTEPDIRHGKIRWPNQRGVNPNAVLQAAREQAWSTVAEGEEVFDLRLEGGVVEKGNNSVMVWSYSYQVVKPGGQAAARYR
jgi:hypothetical protein